MPTELSELIADVREHIFFLQELGIDALEVELPETSTFRDDLAHTPVLKAVASHEPPPVFERSLPPESLQLPKREQVTAPKRSGSRINALPSLKTRIAHAAHSAHTAHGAEDKENMPRSKASTSGDTPALVDITQKTGDTSDTIESIRAEIGDCTRCKLSREGRTQIVHTTGNFEADLMFVGEAPGADEDEQGFPFVGRAGKLLTDIIVAMGFQREQVCIGNINRCRPPGNRKPEPDETAACRPFLLREIAVVKPKVIVVLGATAAHNLLQINTPISQLRGNFQDYFGVKVMPTFHPAYLLRDPHKKKFVWEDMKKVRDHLIAGSES